MLVAACPRCGKSDGYLETTYFESCNNCGYYIVYGISTKKENKEK